MAMTMQNIILSALRKAGVSGVAEVLQALVSTHSKHVVVVKSLKAQPNPVIRMNSRKQEFSLHRELKSVRVRDLLHEH